MGSKTEVCSPTEAEGSIPSEPVMTEASSVSMSPNMFSVTMTSKRLGNCTSCMAALSTNIYSVVMSAFSLAIS